MKCQASQRDATNTTTATTITITITITITTLQPTNQLTVRQHGLLEQLCSCRHGDGVTERIDNPWCSRLGLGLGVGVCFRRTGDPGWSWGGLVVSGWGGSRVALEEGGHLDSCGGEYRGREERRCECGYFLVDIVDIVNIVVVRKEMWGKRQRERERERRAGWYGVHAPEYADPPDRQNPPPSSPRRHSSLSFLFSSPPTTKDLDASRRISNHPPLSESGWLAG